MGNPIGNMVIRVDLDGSGFNKGMAGLNRQMRMVSREMSANLSKFGRYDQSLEKSKVKVEGLTKKQRVQAQKVKELKQEYDKLSKETGENSAKTQAAAAKYNEAYAELNKYERELKEATEKLRALERQQQAMNTTMGKIGSKFSEIGPKFQEIGQKMQSVGRSMSMYVTAPIVAGFGAAAKKSIDFDDSMRKVKATSGATGSEFQQLRDKALEMGAKTKFSASESAEALNYMALAGWDTKDMLGGIDGVMQLAAASGEDLGQVSDIVTDSLTAFGMKAKDSGRFADVLAQTSSKANADVRGLGEAFKYAAPVAGALGYTVEDTSIAIGLMSNAGIKGEKAGTALRTMFTNLAKPTKAMQNKMEELGISITDSNGKMLPMRDVMDQLRDRFKNLSKDQQASAAATIFGKEAMSGALAVINASDEDYKKLTKSIDNSTGAAKRMSDEMEGGIGGSIRQMKSALESLAISIGDVLAPHIKRAAETLGNLAQKLSDSPGWVKTAIVSVGLFAAALGPAILVTGMFTSAIGSIMTTLGPVMTGIAKAGGVMNFLGNKAPFAAKGLTLVGGAFKFMLGPVGLAIAAIVAIGTAFVIAYKKSETFRNIVHSVIDPVMNGLKKMWDVANQIFNALGSLLSGKTLPTVDLLSKIMPKETARKVTVTLMQIRQVFIDAFKGIWSYIQEIGKKLSDFWKENGDTIIQALANIWSVTSTVFIEIKNFLWPILQELGGLVQTLFMNVIVPIIKIAMGIIWNVMKFLWPLIKILIVDTWNNIKNIINGSLDIILGIVKIFSGLFTGQWKQVWNGVKQVFSGALTLIWNLIQLWFIGKILKVVKIFSGLFKGVISSAFKHIRSVISTVLKFIWSIISTIFKRILSITKTIFGAVAKFIKHIWNGIKNAIVGAVKFIYNGVKRYFTAVENTVNKIFTAVKSFVVKTWLNIKNTVVKYAKSLWTGVRNTFNSLSKGVRNIFSRLRRWLADTWRNIKNTVTRYASQLWASVKKTFNNLYNGTRDITNNVKRKVTGIWQGIKKSVTGIASALWSSVKKTFTNMRDGLANIIGKIKDHIGGMVSAIKKGLNGLIKGLNWVGSKLSLPKIPKLSTGTQRINRHVRTTSDGRLKDGTMAIVGDRGPGNGKGKDGRRELIQYPNGRMAMTPAKDTMTWLPKNSRVISGSMRQRYEEAEGAGMAPRFNLGTIPRLSTGTWFGNAKDWVGDKLKGAGKVVGNSAKWLSEKIGDVMDYMDEPGKLLNKVLSMMGIDFSSLTKGMGIVGDITRAAWKKIKKGALDWIKGGFEAQAGDGSVFEGYGILQKYSAPPYPPNPNYPFNGGVHHGVDYDMPVGTPVRTPMAGRVRSWYDNYGGGNAITVSKGKTFLWFMHLSKQLKKTGEQVKAGQLIGKSGNTGSMTNYRHLHFQVNQGGESNSNSVEPLSWLKKNGKGIGGKSGKWNGNIRQALKLAGLPTSQAYVNAWARQIQTESGGNAKAIGGTDGLADGRAMGLVQVKPGTFNAFKLPGHGNIMNGLDNLIAGMRYAKARYGSSILSVIGRGHGYATGGLVHNGLYHLGEEGYPEWIIPTDPKRADDAAKLLALANKDISKNKRPSQLKSVNNLSDDGHTVSVLEKKMDKVIGLLARLVSAGDTIADKDYEPVIDKYAHKQQVFDAIDDYNRLKQRHRRFNPGGV